MNYDTLKTYVDARCTTRQIAKALSTSQTNVRYWLAAHALRTVRAHGSGQFYCKCGEKDPSKYHGQKRSVCARCDNVYTVERQRKTAQKIRDYFDKKCAICGYSTFQIALSLHHLNPKHKDPTFHCIRGWSWNRVVRELQKCRLLCHNCHAAVHAGLVACS